MKYKTVEDPKKICSVRVIDFFDINRVPQYAAGRKPRFLMADFFFLSFFEGEEFGLTEVSKRDAIDKLSFDEDYELKKIYHWEKFFNKEVSEDGWESTASKQILFEDVPKMFWLCDHLRKNGSIEFPITQAWNRYYNNWETTVGNSRIPALRYFYNKDKIDVIRFKTRFCKEIPEWKIKFNSLDDIEKHYDHPAVINYRAWGGNLIPSVHFFNRESYKSSKVEYHNKLVRLCDRDGSLGLNTEQTLYRNISNILEKLDEM